MSDQSLTHEQKVEKLLEGIAMSNGLILSCLLNANSSRLTEHFVADTCGSMEEILTELLGPK